MNEAWPVRLQSRLREGPCVIVTVTAVKGSAPRAVGSRMLVWREGFEGSIGGGNLEYEAQRMARDWLDSHDGDIQKRERFGLGPALRQCCGGAVTLLFERLQSKDAPWLNSATAALEAGSAPLVLVSRTDGEAVRKWLVSTDLPEELGELRAAIEATSERQPRAISLDGGEYLLEELAPRHLHLYLFGAGHVGKALIHALEPLPFQVHWIDGRAGEFPATVPPNVERHVSDRPLDWVGRAAPDSLFLVMTHSHELDEELCCGVLERGDFRWLGLIGSETKASRFRHRLAARGIGEAALERLVCPIGLTGLVGKRPATIAVAVAAQLLAEQVPEGWR